MTRPTMDIETFSVDVRGRLEGLTNSTHITWGPEISVNVEGSAPIVIMTKLVGYLVAHAVSSRVIAGDLPMSELESEISVMAQEIEEVAQKVAYEALEHTTVVD